MMQLTVGARLRSVVCDTEVIVVRAPEEDLDLRCGGHPMAPMEGASPNGASIEPSFASGTTIGKRYGGDDLGVELLVTKGGAGSLSIGADALPVKDPKRLPTSD